MGICARVYRERHHLKAKALIEAIVDVVVGEDMLKIPNDNTSRLQLMNSLSKNSELHYLDEYANNSSPSISKAHQRRPFQHHLLLTPRFPSQIRL